MKDDQEDLFKHPNRLRHLGILWDGLRRNQELPQVDRWLSETFRVEKKYGSRDRKLLSDGIFTIIRQGPQLLADYFGSDFLAKVSSPHQIWENLRRLDFDFVSARLSQRIDSKNIDAKNIDAKSMDAKSSGEIKKPEDLTDFGIHPWFYDAIKKREQLSGWNIENWLSMQAKRPPLWVRLNHPEKESFILKSLKDDGFNIRKIDQSFELTGPKGIYGNESFLKGHIEIQDLASQKLGEKLAAAPGEMIWDACAGGGGKTLQIASQLNNKGAVIATDIRAWKLEEVKKRAKKAQFHNIRTQAWDASQELELSREVKARGGFDRILVDAPCSSSGTFRRNPDSQYRISTLAIKDLATLQLKILTQASKSLRKGGFLAYSTCSFLYEENEGIVEAFLKDNPAFELQSMSMVGAPDFDADSMFVGLMHKK